jgi:hypothetical protein
LSGRASWDDVDAALAEHADFLARAVADRPVQTNEVQRCWVLLPCFLELARRAGAEELDLVELGPSAGLNLVWDRYHYVYEQGGWGQEARLELRGIERGPVPAELLRVRPCVGRRLGIDLAPVDVTTEEGHLLLKSFVWADQTARLDKLDRAVETVRDDPPRLVRGDISKELPRILGERRPEPFTVVWQTAVLGYMSDEEREQVYAALDTASREEPLGWVSAGMPDREPEHQWALKIQIWPEAESSLVAYADYHGSWLEWIA